MTSELLAYKPDGVVLVTTPQNVSLGDVRREVTFCRKAGLPILGIFENMSGFVCPHCKECTNIFSSGGGASLAAMAEVPFLGAIPIDPRIGEALDAGKPVDFSTGSLDAVRNFVERLTATKEEPVH